MKLLWNINDLQTECAHFELTFNSHFVLFNRIHLGVTHGVWVYAYAYAFKHLSCFIMRWPLKNGLPVFWNKLWHSFDKFSNNFHEFSIIWHFAKRKRVCSVQHSIKCAYMLFEVEELDSSSAFPCCENIAVGVSFTHSRSRLSKTVHSKTLVTENQSIFTWIYMTALRN